MRYTILALVCLLAFACKVHAEVSSPLDKIKHVFVLMMENRSFDHMLGFLKKKNPEVNGCLPSLPGCSNPKSPQDPNSPIISVDGSAVYVQVSPSHSIHATTQQIYGFPDHVTPPEGSSPAMNGFISSYQNNFPEDPAAGETVMKCFSPDHVPIITTLAEEFGFFDAWHASVPGPTMVNRAYAGSATSNGMGVNDAYTIAKGMPQKTMFRQMVEMGHDYRVYFSDAPSVLMFKDMRHKLARQKVKPISHFKNDVAAGDVPELVWIEPGYFSYPNHPASDQHPDHDVSVGEQLMKDVYESIRNSPVWNESALIITYDEHGGFFDHVSPPENVPSPDGKNSTDDPFDFTRLGVRIPTVVVSPWVKKGSVFHGPTNSSAGQFDHTSTISTIVHKLFRPVGLLPKQDFLTKRDAWAATFEYVFDTVKLPRTDCITQLPEVVSHNEAFPGSLPALDGSLPLSDLQMEMIQIVAGLDDSNESLGDLSTWTEQMGFEYCKTKMDKFLSSA